MIAPVFKATMVTLVDGRAVFSDAEEWRHECEAKSILKLSPLAQGEYLRDIERIRSVEAAAKLRETMRQLEQQGAPA